MNQTKETIPTELEPESLLDVPKSAEIFRGDINHAVIEVQKRTGVEIDDSWWFSRVGNMGTTESILKRFDDAYAEKMADEQKPPLDETPYESIESKEMELKEFEAQKEESAWEHYAPIGSDEYEEANANRIKRNGIKIIKIDGNNSVTLVSSIKVDPETGNAISGHEYRPEAVSMRDIENAFKEYVVSTPREEQVLIYEGDERIYDDRDEAIRRATDSGLVQHLASREDIPAVSGEPTDQETLAIMEQLGVTREELLAYYVARGLESQLSGPDAEFLAGYINFQAAKLGVEGFRYYSETEKQKIVEDGGLETVKVELANKVTGILPKLNELYRPALSGEDLLVSENGEIKVNPKINYRIGEVSMDSLGWEGDNRINQIAKLNLEMRDRVIFHRIAESNRQGKKPFVVYGGSHMISLEPVARAYSEI